MKLKKKNHFFLQIIGQILIKEMTVRPHNCMAKINFFILYHCRNGWVSVNGRESVREREREREKRDTCGKRLKLSFFVLKSCLELDPFLLDFAVSKMLTFSTKQQLTVINFSTSRFGYVFKKIEIFTRWLIYKLSKNIKTKVELM